MNNSTRILFFIFLFCFLVCPVFSQEWSVLHQFNPAQTLQKIEFHNKDFGITVGSLYNGSTKNIHITRDGGKTWMDVSSGYTSMRFMDIAILNDSVMYMSGNNGIIIRSTDGGLNWKTLTTNVTEQIWGIYFIDAKIGYAVGSNGLIMRTNNAGNDWEIRPSGTNHLFYKVTVTSSGVCFASGSNILLRSEDGGDSWQAVDFFPFEPPADWIRSIQFVNDQTGYACADIGRIYKTNDGGKTWYRLPSITQEPLFELHFLDENFGMVCGFNGTILKTENGGMSWTPMTSPLGNEHLYSIDLIDKDNGYICSHFGNVLQLKNASDIDDESNDNSALMLYPNPANDWIHIHAKNEISDKQKHQATLIDGHGHVLLNFEIQEFSRLDISNYPVGIYTILVEGDLSQIMRFIKI
ncbi:MAG: T9SS type A sorting domain-containing protein [Saprospiraceae bacterium]|nr:T9SS type A sorting domain-containing protein [Saprospiraceae bacterium]